MSENVGNLDRILRAVLGVVLILAPFVSGSALFTGWVAYLSVAVGLVMLGVAATRVCPIYTLIGIKTCKD